MKPIKTVSIITTVMTGLLAATTAFAQPGPGPAGGTPGGGMGPRSGADYTSGWSLMTSKERDEHRAKMRSFKTYEECKAYQEQHREQMLARAKERGVKTPAQPRRDACAWLKK
jgi:hypothetical protein